MNLSLPMKKLALLLTCLSATTGLAAETDAQRAALQFFEKEVRPVLANRCYECHGEKKQKGRLRMDHIALYQGRRRLAGRRWCRAIRTNRR